MNTTSRPIAPYIVGLLITALLITIVYSALFVPKFESTAQLKTQTSEAAAANQALAQKVAEVDENKKNKAELARSIAKFNASFPVGASQQSLLDDIAAAAADSGATLTGLNPAVPVAVENEAVIASDPTLDPDYDPALDSVQITDRSPVASGSDILAEVNMTINATGSRASLEAFVSRLESMPRPVTVGSVSIDGEGDLTSLSITASTFFVAPLVDPDKVTEAAIK